MSTASSSPVVTPDDLLSLATDPRVGPRGHLLSLLIPHRVLNRDVTRYMGRQRWCDTMAIDTRPWLGPPRLGRVTPACVDPRIAAMYSAVTRPPAAALRALAAVLLVAGTATTEDPLPWDLTRLETLRCDDAAVAFLAAYGAVQRGAVPSRLAFASLPEVCLNEDREAISACAAEGVGGAVDVTRVPGRGGDPEPLLASLAPLQASLRSLDLGITHGTVGGLRDGNTLSAPTLFVALERLSLHGAQLAEPGLFDPIVALRHTLRALRLPYSHIGEALSTRVPLLYRLEELSVYQVTAASVHAFAIAAALEPPLLGAVVGLPSWDTPGCSSLTSLRFETSLLTDAAAQLLACPAVFPALQALALDRCNGLDRLAHFGTLADTTSRGIVTVLRKAHGLTLSEEAASGIVAELAQRRDRRPVLRCLSLDGSALPPAETLCSIAASPVAATLAEFTPGVALAGPPPAFDDASVPMISTLRIGVPLCRDPTPVFPLSMCPALRDVDILRTQHITDDDVAALAQRPLTRLCLTECSALTARSLQEIAAGPLRPHLTTLRLVKLPAVCALPGFSSLAGGFGCTSSQQGSPALRELNLSSSLPTAPHPGPGRTTRAESNAVIHPDAVAVLLQLRSLTTLNAQGEFTVPERDAAALARLPSLVELTALYAPHGQRKPIVLEPAVVQRFRGAWYANT